MISFDPMYYVFVLPAFLLSIYAQFKVKAAYARAAKVPCSSHYSGIDITKKILLENGISNVGIEVVPGELSDHYDAKAKMLRLSEDVAHGRTVAALGIAAHEAGHAIQDATGYAPLVLRNGIVPLASVGSNLSFGLMLVGGLLGMFNLVILGVLAFSIVVIFQLINLPVEFDASRRAKEILFRSGIVSGAEQREVASVLNAAAMTYVAATLTALLTLVYYMWRLGVIGGRSDD